MIRRTPRSTHCPYTTLFRSIESVTMGLPNKGMLLEGAPLAYKQNPQNVVDGQFSGPFVVACGLATGNMGWRSEEHTSELQSRQYLVCRFLLENMKLIAVSVV